MSRYTPPYTITSRILLLTNEITEMLAEVRQIKQDISAPILRKKNRVRSITGSLQIEGNTLSEEEVTALIDGKQVLGSVREIEEVKGAIRAYDAIESYRPEKLDDLLRAHQHMMGGILDNAGRFRSTNVGVYGKDGISHVAPPPYQIHELMHQLFDWLTHTQEHPLLVSSVFHYEFEFIHPFNDGNGRIGRLWQNVILGHYKNIFYYVPIESVVKAHQRSYYAALEKAGETGESTPFVEFMLESIHESVRAFLKEHKKSDQKSKQKSDQKVLDLMRKDNTITIRELALRLDMSDSGIKKVITKLKNEERIQRIGGAKGGHWHILQDR